MHRSILSAAVAAAILALGAGPVAAQDPDFGSEQNRVWWNGVTPNELQELAVEAGATYSRVSDNGSVVVSRLEWPEIGAVEAWQGRCVWNDGVVDRNSNCVEMVLFHDTSAPSDIDQFRAFAPIWLTANIVDNGKLRLHRYDIYAFGTTRGRVLADLMLFKTYVAEAHGILDEMDGY